VYEPNLITFSGNIYKNIPTQESPIPNIVKMTDPPTFRMSGPITRTYVERHFASVLYCQMPNGELYTYH